MRDCRDPTATKRLRHLTDMGDLLHRRGDECREAFPFGLPNHGQPATEIARRLIAGSSGTRDRFRPADDRAQSSARSLRGAQAAGPFAKAAANFQNASLLLYINRALTERSHKSPARFLPMKHLPGAQRRHEIELRAGNFLQRRAFHVPSYRRRALALPKFASRQRRFLAAKSARTGIRAGSFPLQRVALYHRKCPHLFITPDC